MVSPQPQPRGSSSEGVEIGSGGVEIFSAGASSVGVGGKKSSTLGEERVYAQHMLSIFLKFRDSISKV